MNGKWSTGVFWGCGTFNFLQNHQTPLHLAAHSGHVEVLRVLIKDYHADKMVKAMVNECQANILCQKFMHS